MFAQLALPTLDRDSALIAAAIVVLLTVAIASRSLLAWFALRDRVRSLDRLVARLDEDRSGLTQRAAAARTELTNINGAVERALWALPALDARVANATGKLEDGRHMLDSWRHNDAELLRRLIDRIRGTLGAIRAALRLRRAINR